MKARFTAVLVTSLLALALAGTAGAATKRVSVRLSKSPPVRVWCSFDAQDGSHVSLVWEPGDATALAQVVSLSDQQWNFSCGSDVLVSGATNDAKPSRYVYAFREARVNGGESPLKDLETIGATLKSIDLPNLASETVYGYFVDSAAESAAPEKGLAQWNLAVQVLPLTKLSLGEAKKGFAAQGAVQPRGRSLEDAAPQLVVDLLQTLADIAFERAKSKGLAILTDRIQRFVCEELKYNPDAVTVYLQASAGTAPGGALIEKAGDGDNGKLLLPSTCDAIRHVRVQELAATARALIDSLLSDLGAFAFDVVLVHLSADVPSLKPVIPVINKLTGIMARAAAGQGAITTRDAHLLVVALAQVDWPNVVSGDLNVGCGLELAFATLASCYQKGGCEAREIAAIIADSAEYFDRSACTETAWTQVSTSWPDLDVFVSRAMDLMNPPSGASSRDVARGATSLVLDVAQRVACGVPGDQCQKALAAEIIGDVRRASSGIIDREPVSVIIAASSLLQRVLPKMTDAVQNSRLRVALERTGRLLAAVTAYASTYAAVQDDPKKAQAARDARKKAVENLIDATTDRRQRDGEWVVSLGASVGFLGVGIDQPVSKGTDRLTYAQLELPIGVAVQFLPDGRNKNLNWWKTHTGFHAQISPIDVAQFVAFDKDGTLTDVRWANFVTASLTMGFIIGTPSTPFIIGTDLRWSPTLFAEEQAKPGAMPDPMTGRVPTIDKMGALRFGLFFGYYVPFFDFN